MQKCLICGQNQFKCIHKGTRDVSDIKVLKCMECGCVQLESREYNTEENYAAGGMLCGGGYNALTDERAGLDWDAWTRQTEVDDERRFRRLSDLCRGKKVLEFGCGSGGFLRRMKKTAGCVAGIELMDEARERLEKEGIHVYKKLAGDEMYDVICMFSVIEHLNHPDEVLRSIRQHLKVGGTFICETCNADDALITKYHCAAFEDYTYWSRHVFLFNSLTLERLMLRNGFLTLCNEQVQRYTLANHLYWLAAGRPGGHLKWTEFNDEELNRRYAQLLAGKKIGDTLWYEGTVEEHVF